MADEMDLEEVARLAFDWVGSVAVAAGGGLGWLEDGARFDDLYAGTARLFVLLDEIDPQPRWRGAIDACIQALRDSRLPLRLYPGYWDNLARCCGTAGVGQLLLDRYQATGDLALLGWAGTLAADVVGRAVITPQGITWSNTEHTATPPELPPQPGFMQGAAGIAGWLARLHALRCCSGAPASVPRPGPAWL